MRIIVTETDERNDRGEVLHIVAVDGKSSAYKFALDKAAEYIDLITARLPDNDFEVVEQYRSGREETITGGVWRRQRRRARGR